MTGRPFPPVRVPGDEKLWELARAEAAKAPPLTEGQIYRLSVLTAPAVRAIMAGRAADERGAA